MPDLLVIKNSNSPDLMRCASRFCSIQGLARFPLNVSHGDFFRSLGVQKMNQHEVEKMDVSLISGDDGFDRVAISLEGEGCSALTLTPAQARILATELISAVNRAEVKKSLQSSPNMWRRQGEARPRLASATELAH
jgi:hypothetical protein